MLALAAAVLAFAAAPAAAAPRPLAPATVLARYAAAVAALREPATLTFDYALVQGGTRSAEQHHRVFRHAADERDETLDQSGRVLLTRIFRNRRNRYTVHGLAPGPGAYAFAYVGTVRDARHVDYVFRTTPRFGGAFVVTEVAVDGVRFLPVRIAFRTREHAGRGTIAFGVRGAAWVVTSAEASASERDGVATERISFSAYHFPKQLPPSTFAAPRPLASAPPG